METVIVSENSYLTQEPAGNQWEPVAGTEHGILLPRNGRKFTGTDRFLPGVFDLGFKGFRTTEESLFKRFDPFGRYFKSNERLLGVW